jgi:hypothetical protein
VQIEIDAISGPAGALAHAQERQDKNIKDGKSQKEVLRALESKKDDLEEDLENRDFVPQAKET